MTVFCPVLIYRLHLYVIVEYFVQRGTVSRLIFYYADLHLIERAQTEEQELLKTETNNRSILSTIEMIKFKILCAAEYSIFKDN